MLIEFTVGNYRSFKDPVTFSMLAANLKSRQTELNDNNTFQVDNQPRLLTSAAVYGPNASGKSNFVSALNIMRRLVLFSVNSTQRTGGIAVEPFRLSQHTLTEPSHFEAVFISDNRRFRYGFEVTHERVESEWLYFVPSSREARLFKRERDNIIIGETYFKEGKELESKTRPNALFLAIVAQFDGTLAQMVVSWFQQLVVAFQREDDYLRFLTIERLFGKQSDAIQDFVRGLDLDIEELEVVQNASEREANSSTPTGSRATQRRALALRQLPLIYMDEGDLTIATTHRVYDEKGNLVGRTVFDLDLHESAGTQKLVALAGPIVDTLVRGEVLVVDELDARLHPLLTREIVRLFNDPVANPHHAQLIFTTHDTNLLDNQLLRRDQIWFVEKDRQGASDLYSLAEFKVRNDKAYERGYIQGRYGAIPYFGDLRTLTGESNAAQR